MTPDHIVADIQTQAVQRDGKVHLLFSRDVEGQLRSAETSHVMWPASEALRAGQMIIDLAFEADTGLKPVGPAAKAELVNKHRKVLLQRVEVMLNSMREKRILKTHDLAVAVVDVCLKEIFA
jgi:hypothetical protein